jgi:V/A-type H+-transporting ATPase subunit B
MRADVTATGTATRIEGPLVFLKRTLDVGLNTAVRIRGADGRGQIGRAHV